MATAIAFRLGERPEEVIDGAAQASPIDDLVHPKQTLVDRQRAVGRDDEHMIALEWLSVSRLLHGEAGDVGQQLRHETLVRRIEVHDHDERQPRLRRHRAEKRLERLEAARRRADTDDRRTG